MNPFPGDPMRISTFAMLAVIGFAAARPCEAQDAPTGRWTERTRSGSPLTYGALTSDGTFVYEMGGYFGPDTRRYDPVRNTWSILADMPAICLGNSAACYGGKIYSFGNATGEIYRYTISTNTWQLLPVALVGSRSFACCAA